MEVPAPEMLLARIRAMPAAKPLLAAVADTPGVYLVGGAVRDLLLGVASSDLDLVVDGDPSQVLSRLGGDVRVHDRFGTATVTRDGRSYDFARARRERYREPGALPEVEPASIDEDLERRDFTVNAVAVELGGPSAGEVRAVPDALGDLDARRLRVLHERSFIDDPTRLLRLARYAARVERFKIEPGTRALAGAAVAGDALGTVSGPRLGAELRLLAREADPVRAFAVLQSLGADDAIAPGFGLGDPQLAGRAMRLLPTGGRQDRLVLALGALDLRDEQVGALFERLGFESGDRDAISAAAGRAVPVSEALADATRPSQIADAVAGGLPELVALAGALGPEQAARDWLERLRLVQLDIDGADLIAAGIPEGPGVGRGLRAALDAKLDGQASSREAELAQALAAAREQLS